MKITMPHYGNAYIGLKILFDGLGISYIIPSPPNAATLDLGIKHAPEEICQPFKLMLGNLIQSIDQGADTVLMIATSGPCRFGEYAELLRRLLIKAGYQVNFIVLYTQQGKKALLEQIKKITQQSTCPKRGRSKYTLYALRGLLLMDHIEAHLRYLSGYEVHKGDCQSLLRACYQEVLATNNARQALKSLVKYKKSSHDIKTDAQKSPLKVALVGEIYTISDPFSNKYIEDTLMNQGISVSRGLTPSWWVKDSLLKPFKINSLKLRRAAKEYIYDCAGGYTRETIGKTLISQKDHFDGAIQIFPVGCTPEIIAKPILEKISADKKFPILTLVVDEMTGNEGYNTRVEAFIDMLERRRELCI